MRKVLASCRLPCFYDTKLTASYQDQTNRVAHLNYVTEFILVELVSLFPLKGLP